MFTLLQETTDNLYTIVDFDNKLWLCEVSGNGNWFDTVNELLNHKINQSDDVYNEDAYSMKHSTTVQEWVNKLTLSEEHVTPKIICQFESFDTLQLDYPELFL